MFGLTVQNVRLNEVLAPVASILDTCWWNLGGAGASFPWIEPPKHLPAEAPPAPKRGPGRHRATRPPLGPPDPVGLERYLAESRAASAEYQNWVDGATASFRIAKPGLFSRYAAGMQGDWQIYFASDAAVMPTLSLGEVERRFDDWFAPPPDDLPADICLITRDIDHAYLDLFFRDEWMYQSVRGYLESRRIGVEPFKPKVFRDANGQMRDGNGRLIR